MVQTHKNHPPQQRQRDRGYGAAEWEPGHRLQPHPQNQKPTERVPVHGSRSVRQLPRSPQTRVYRSVGGVMEGGGAMVRG